jgi:ribosomal protein S18 acetylase RimI-like enzyme
MDRPSVHKIIAYASFDGSPEGTRREVEKYQNNDNLNFYGYFCGNEVTGICGFEEHTDKIEIHLISVDKKQRHQGIGSAMVSELRNKCHKLIEAETDDDAVNFYRKCGFSVTAFTHLRHGKRWTCVMKTENL